MLLALPLPSTNDESGVSDDNGVLPCCGTLYNKASPSFLIPELPILKLSAIHVPLDDLYNHDVNHYILYVYTVMITYT